MKNPISKINNQFYVNPTGVKGKEIPFSLGSLKRWSEEFRKEFESKSDEFQINVLAVCFFIAVHHFEPDEDPVEYHNGLIKILMEKYPGEIETLDKMFKKSKR